MIKQVVLVQPPQAGLLDGFASGLIDLANFIAPKVPETDITILDLGLEPNTVVSSKLRSALKKAEECETLIGVTTTTATYHSALAVARAAKQINRNGIVVLGGHHASPQHDVVLRHHGDIVDFVIRGEGERSLLALIKGENVETIPGLSFWDKDKLQVNPTGHLLTSEELDLLGVDFDGQSFDSAPGKFNRVTYVSARGCPLRCAFCAVAGEPIRCKSVGRVIEDLFQLVFGKGYQQIAIEDNFFAQKKSRTLSLCEAIREFRARITARFTWDCQTRVESLYDQTVIRALAEAGCDGVYLGVEALSIADLLYLGKTAQPERYLELLATSVVPHILENGIECNINLQVCLPEETELSRTARLMRLQDLGRLAQRGQRAVIVFPQLNVIYPGTAHFWRYIQEQRFGRIGLDVFEGFTEWEAENQPVLKFLGENFAHGVGGIPIGILNQQDLQNGKFSIDQRQIDAVRQHLDAIAQIDGVCLFRYGSYLAHTHCQDREAQPV